MKRFEFQFATLLQLRRNERDLLRRELADLRKRLDELCQQRDHHFAKRLAQLDELREMTAENELNVEASLSRRDYAARLADEITRLDDERQNVEVQIDHCRSTVLQSDQGVEALEKLAEKHLLLFTAFHERRESLQHEEAWQAQHAMQAASH